MIRRKALFVALFGFLSLACIAAVAQSEGLSSTSGPTATSVNGFAQPEAHAGTRGEQLAPPSASTLGISPFNLYAGTGISYSDMGFKKPGFLPYALLTVENPNFLVRTIALVDSAGKMDAGDGWGWRARVEGYAGRRWLVGGGVGYSPFEHLEVHEICDTSLLWWRWISCHSGTARREGHSTHRCPLRMY